MRTPPDNTAREIPCPRWSLEETHPAHEWDAPVDGHSECPGWAAPVAPDDLITVARWAEANGGPGSLIQAAARRLLGVIDHANYLASSHASSHASEHAAAAEDLRERIAEALITRIKASVIIDPVKQPGTVGQPLAATEYDLADAVLAELAGDPGDLPARMAAELNSHEWEPCQRHTAHRTHNYHGACAICQEDLPRIAAVAMSVRCEDHVRQAVQLEDARVNLTTAQGLLADERAHSKRAYEKLAASEAQVERLRVIGRVTAPPAADEMPTDPAELREMWEFINRQARWQWHMAHKFGDEVERLRAELAEAKTGRERYAVATGNWTASAVEQRARAETAETDLAEMKAIATERSEACARAEAERDALQTAVERVRDDCGAVVADGFIADDNPVIWVDGAQSYAKRVLALLDANGSEGSGHSPAAKAFMAWIEEVGYRPADAALAAPETTTERTDLIAAYAVHLRSAGDRADKAEAVIARSRSALAAFDGRGVNNFDAPTPREVLDAWTASLAAPEGNEGAPPADPWLCPRCGSSRWVAASLTGPVQYGGRAIRQCVLCGHYSSDPVDAPETTPDAPTERTDR